MNFQKRIKGFKLFHASNLSFFKLILVASLIAVSLSLFAGTSFASEYSWDFDNKELVIKQVEGKKYDIKISYSYPVFYWGTRYTCVFDLNKINLEEVEKVEVIPRYGDYNFILSYNNWNEDWSDGISSYNSIQKKLYVTYWPNWPGWSGNIDFYISFVADNNSEKVYKFSEYPSILYTDGYFVSGGGSQFMGGTVNNWYFYETATLNDVTAPDISVYSPEQRDYQISEDLTIGYSITDDISGVASMSATLNGQPVDNGQVIDLFNLPLGQHTFTVNAVDNAGNSSSREVAFNIVASPGSAISVINELINSGDIPPNIANGLIAQLKAAQKSIELGQVDAAIGQLNGFIKTIEAQSGKKIDEDIANLLIQAAQSIIDNL